LKTFEMLEIPRTSKPGAKAQFELRTERLGFGKVRKGSDWSGLVWIGPGRSDFDAKIAKAAKTAKQITEVGRDWAPGQTATNVSFPPPGGFDVLHATRACLQGFSALFRYNNKRCNRSATGEVDGWGVEG
jgi:hypothetical protein